MSGLGAIGAISGAFKLYKMYIFGALALLLVGFVTAHLWGDHKDQKRYDKLLIKNEELKQDNEKLQLDFDTCAATNAENLVEINAQNEAIDKVAKQRDEALKSGQKVVAELAKARQKAKEDSRVLRSKVQTMLVAEQCAVASLPVDVQRVLNDAIAKANSG